MRRSVLFVLDDADKAGYFYHDLTQMMGQEKGFLLSFQLSACREIPGSVMQRTKSYVQRCWRASLSGGHFR